MAALLLTMPSSAHALPGDDDSTFGERGELQMQSLSGGAAILSDNKLLLVTDDIPRTRFTLLTLSRYTLDGDRDTSFGIGGTATVRLPIRRSETTFLYTTEALEFPDGHILVAGVLLQYDDTQGPTYSATMIKLTSAGQLDTSFGEDGVVIQPKSSALWTPALTALPDGRVLGHGVEFGPKNATPRVSRWLANGSPDTSFAAGGDLRFPPSVNLSNITDLLVDASGPGYLISIVDTNQPLPTFQQAGIQAVRAQLRNRRSMGTFASGNISTRLVRLQADGTVDSTWGVNGERTITARNEQQFAGMDLLRTSGGELRLAGAGAVARTGSMGTIVGLDPSGLPDLAFGDRGTAIVSLAPGLMEYSSLTEMPNSDLVAAGSYYGASAVIDNLSWTAVTRFDSAGLMRRDHGTRMASGWFEPVAQGDKVLLVGRSYTFEGLWFSVRRLLGGSGAADSTRPTPPRVRIATGVQRRLSFRVSIQTTSQDKHSRFGVRERVATDRGEFLPPRPSILDGTVIRGGLWRQLRPYELKFTRGWKRFYAGASFGFVIGVDGNTPEPLPRGRTICMSARAYDRANNRSDWGPESCTVLPTDDSFLWFRGQWGAGRGKRYLGGSGRSTREGGASVVAKGLHAKRLSILARTGPQEGDVLVRWNGHVIGRTSLRRDKSGFRTVIPVASFKRVQKGTLVVEVVGSGRRVSIDGIGVSHV